MSRDKEIPFDQFLTESIEKIDEVIKEKIIKGFVFEGHIFSMSIEAQLNWSNLFLIPEESFPLIINTKEDEPYLLTFEKRDLFYKSAMNHKMIWLMQGSSIKTLIKSKNDVTEINDIISNFIAS